MKNKNKHENFMPALFSDIFSDAKFFGRNWLDRDFHQLLPAVNIKENHKDFDVELAVPGFKKEDFKVNVENNVLTINAEKKEDKNEETSKYTRKEFTYSSFSRSFSLPENINSEKIDAKYSDGILRLRVPKKETTKSLPKKEITID
ncbi:Hsp20/alpha crystallin family protein [Fluviicola sp.]|jgi:HSP20 family protein|uniref:Hsp20/alpha crystallin family protein n=1 Tax=Fluviicola sp. TaxID=1917219 RepID=UPI0028184B79|nr:Hsp20/alpha crystallin family protein [Fluviicola sp.]MDR0801013.1 Hsp20/alpha crystallin family protein [Fluviicola sp.]